MSWSLQQVHLLKFKWTAYTNNDNFDRFTNEYAINLCMFFQAWKITILKWYFKIFW